jgi:hypothetical protein
MRYHHAAVSSGRLTQALGRTELFFVRWLAAYGVLARLRLSAGSFVPPIRCPALYSSKARVRLSQLSRMESGREVWQRGAR